MLRMLVALPNEQCCSDSRAVHVSLFRLYQLCNGQECSWWAQEKEPYMFATILIVVLILALLGGLPRWSHSSNWGYYPTGGVGLVLLVVVVLLLLGRI